MYNIVLTNYGNTQISSKVILDGVILLSDYISNISTVTSVTGYSVKLDIPARGNAKDKIGNILIRDDSTNAYTAKTILFYKNVNSEKKIIAGFSQNSAIINKLNKAINLFLSFDFSVFTNGFQFALVQAGFSQASQNVDGLVHIEDPNIDFDDSYSVYSKVQIDNKLSSYAQTSDIPTKTSQLTNDSNFINQHQSIKTINNQSLVGTGNIAISQGEYNKINTISVNGTNQAPDSNKNVNITVPTKTSQLTNDSGFITDGTGATNYVTIDTVQDITAAKTFKNNTDTTKIDGKEIIISGTETYNIEQNPDFPDTPTSATATIETKIDNNTISCNGNSIGYYRNYYLMFDQPSMQTVPYHCDGIEIKSKSYDSVWSNTDDKQHEWYSLTVSSKDINVNHNSNYIEGLAFSTDIIRDNYDGDLNNGKEVLFAISKRGAYFNTSVNFNLTTYFDSDVQFSSSVYVYQDNLFISDGNSSSTSETIAAYVKQSSLYYNRTNSVITATSDSVIEPSSNNTISLGTSTNKFSNIYATTFNGNLNGNASSATTATNADHAISADSATTADSASYADMADTAASADYATKATQDGNGNTISSYYCTLSTEQIISGKKIFSGGNVDFVLGDNTRNISFRYSTDYKSWTWITCLNNSNDNYIKLHFTNNNTDVIQLTHTCTSELVNNAQKVKSLVTDPSVDNVWQLGALNKRLSNIYTTTLSLTAYAVTNGTYNTHTLSVGTYGIQSDSTICPSSDGGCSLGNSDRQWGTVYANNLGISGYPIKTMHISGGNGGHYITIDNSGNEPTIAPDTSNYCYLGTKSKHWYNAYINNIYVGSNLYVGSNNVNLPPITAAGITTIGSIQFLRVAIPVNTTTGLINAGAQLSSNRYTLDVVTATPGYTYLGFRFSQTASGTWVTLTNMYYYNDSSSSATYTYVLAYKQA